MAYFEAFQFHSLTHNRKRTHYSHFLLFVFSHACRIQKSNENYYVHILHTFFHWCQRDPLRSVTPFTAPLHLFLLQPRSPVLALSLHLNGIHLCQTFTMRCLSFPITSIYFSVFLHIFSIFRSQRCCCCCCWCWCLLLAGSSCLFICVLCSIAKIALHSFRHRPAELLSCFCY